MKARLGAWLERLGDQFWLRPALVVIVCLITAQGAVWIETTHTGPGASAEAWGYGGGAEGARALLSAVASSSIGAAGTIFSITIAALSLASGQMGPRLLRNFVRDSRNQFALGIFVGTFAYALMVLRTVRTHDKGAFIPHAAVTGARTKRTASQPRPDWAERQGRLSRPHGPRNRTPRCEMHWNSWPASRATTMWSVPMS